MSRKPKEEEIEVTDAMVIEVAKDINNVLAPEPLLDLKKPGEELQKEVEELFPGIKEGDLLSKETWKILKSLGWKNEVGEIVTEVPIVKKEKKIRVKKEKGPRIPSAKETLYLAWKANKEITAKELAVLSKGDAQEKTARGWMRGWLVGKRLPACAKK